jgi:hypothetical protein
MKYIYLILLATSLTIISCNKEDNSAELEEFLWLDNLSVNELIGEWEWENSNGGLGLAFLTPETEGYNKTIIFDSNRNYQEYIDSELVLETHYRVDTVVSEMSGYKIYKIFYFNGKNEQNFLIPQVADTTYLVFYDRDCRDCVGTHEYSRK